MAEAKTFKIRDKSTGKVFTVREKSQDTSVKKESVSESTKPTITSEAKKIGGQFLSGLAMDIPNIGKKPISEVLAGQPGSNFEVGMKITDAIISRDASKLNQPTLNSKFGFPVPPEPETNVGKILGLGANLAGQAITGRIIANAMRTSLNLKLPKSSNIEDAIRQVETNTKNLVETNQATLSREADRMKTTKLFRDIKNNETLSAYEVEKRVLADKQAIKVQDRLALKASKELGNKFGEEYQAAANGKYITLDDYQESLEGVLRKYGIIDDAGEANPNANLSTSQQKVLNLYNDLKSKRPNDVIQFDVEKMPLTELDRNLKSVLVRGKQYGSGDHILTDLRYEFSDKVADLRKIGSKYAQDFKDRNAVFDVFKPFGRRGEADVKSGISLFENLASEDPSKVYPQNQRMMEFISKYAGEDPSAPVKAVGGKIKSLKLSSAEDDLRSKFSFDELESRITNSTMRAMERAEDMKVRLSQLKETAIQKEAKDALKKKIAVYAGSAAAGTVAGAGAVDAVKKFVP